MHTKYRTRLTKKRGETDIFANFDSLRERDGHNSPQETIGRKMCMRALCIRSLSLCCCSNSVVGVVFRHIYCGDVVVDVFAIAIGFHFLDELWL